LVRRASDRCTAAQLLEHPFLASAVLDTKLEAVAGKWVSPKSTLDAAFWEFSESDSEEGDDELSQSTADRIKELACPASALPDWDSDEGWIDVLSAAPTEAQDAVAVPTEENSTDLADAITSEEANSAVLDITMDSSDSSVLNVGAANCDSVWEHNRHHSLEISVCHELLPCELFCSRSINELILFLRKHSASLCSSVSRAFVFFWGAISLVVLPLPPRRHVQLASSLKLVGRFR
jgi:hypothetical protein